MANQSSKLRSGTARVDARLLLTVIDHIANHRGIGNPELQAITGLSRASVHRLLVNAQDQYGVKIVYTRHAFAEGGEYSIDDWGVFDQRKVAEFLSDGCAPDVHKISK
jgi:hypothetical protein